MTIHLVGLGLDPENLPELHQEIIDHAQVLAGAEKELAVFGQHPAKKILLPREPKEAAKLITSQDSELEICVLCSGDPLYYGLGSRLVDLLDTHELRILPNVTALQMAAARLKVPWHQVETVRLRGDNEDFQPLFAALMYSGWVAVLPEKQTIPASIAQALLDRGADNYAMWVFEDMESEKERFQRYNLAVASQRKFSQLSLVLLERLSLPEFELSLGVAESQLQLAQGQHETPWAVRANALAALRLRPGNVVWILGSASGAMAMEAGYLIRRGRVLAVERHAQIMDALRENIRRHAALLVEPVHGTPPRCLADLPDPDRILLHHDLAKQQETLDAAIKRLQPQGRLVVLTSDLDWFQQARSVLEEQGWQLDGMLMQGASLLPGGRKSEQDKAVGPIFLLAAERP